MSKIKTIIVDDELDACEGLQLLLSKDEEITVVSICRNGREAIGAINQHRPDLVFLDIQMPTYNGFEVLDQLNYSPPAIVFITAYDEYALMAFEVHALDYLQKPFSDERFYDMLSHVKGQLKTGNSKPRVLPTEQVESLQNKLRIKSSGKIHWLNYDEVLQIEGFDYYVKVHLKDHFLLVRESLKHLLERLPSMFRQVHKSNIVNINHVRSLEARNRGGYELSLSNGTSVATSRHYRSQIAELL